MAKTATAEKEAKKTTKKKATVKKAAKTGKKYLVIVESPAKAATIGKFLGNNYKIEASMGHVRDMPKSQMGIDFEHDFEPKYITIRGKGELLGKLRKDAKAADKVYLATDPDREGEAISWHLLHALNLGEEKPISRITFNEITKTAVKKSITEARDIDMDLVDAQQARRVLDRVVGYTISDLLWKKVKKGLSGGRVQSVALRLICDREGEIREFIPEEYWTLGAKLKDADGKGYLYVYMGTGEQAAAADEADYIPFTEQADGTHSFTVPVDALDEGIDCAAFSKKKEKWYDRTILFRADSLPMDAFADGVVTTPDSLSLADGSYTADVALAGGSGRASVQSPAELTVKDGKVTAKIVWSSKNYDYMKVGDTKYDTVIEDEHSTFEIPVSCFDWAMAVKADTTAMSEAHEIDYTLTFDSASVAPLSK